MAQQTIDTTGNEPAGITFAKIKAMLAELYSTVAGAITPSSVTATGAVQGATVVGTTSVTGAVVNSTGLMTAGTVKVDTGTKTAAATGGAATLNKASGKITSEDLTTAAGAVYTLTITDSAIAAADIVIPSLANGTNTQGIPVIEKATPGAGSMAITVRNNHASEALNGTLVISFVSFKA